MTEQEVGLMSRTDLKGRADQGHVPAVLIENWSLLHGVNPVESIAASEREAKRVERLNRLWESWRRTAWFGAAVSVVIALNVAMPLSMLFWLGMLVCIWAGIKLSTWIETTVLDPEILEHTLYPDKLTSTAFREALSSYVVLTKQTVYNLHVGDTLPDLISLADTQLVELAKRILEEERLCRNAPREFWTEQHRKLRHALREHVKQLKLLGVLALDAECIGYFNRAQKFVGGI